MNYKRFLIVSVTFIGGLYFFLEFLLAEEVYGYKFGKYHEQIILGLRIIGSMAVGLGIINILQVHGVRLLKAQKGWGNSFALLLGFLLMLFFEGASFVYTTTRSRSVEQLENLQEFVRVIEEDRVSQRMAYLEETPVPPEYRVQTMFPVIDRHLVHWQELLAKRRVFLNSAQAEKSDLLIRNLKTGLVKAQDLRTAYESLTHKRPAAEDPDEIRNSFVSEIKSAAQLERELGDVVARQDFSAKVQRFLYEGFFVSLGSAMFSLLAFYIAGAAYRAFRVRSMEATILMVTAVLMILGQIPQGRMYISEDLPAIRGWLLENINTPGNRAIYFGSAMAGLAMAIRMWLSLERSPLESSEENR